MSDAIYMKILSNWLRSDAPGNKARLENNSAMMQPELHISTALLYGWLRSTSGDRYHNVTTCWMNSDWSEHIVCKIAIGLRFTTDVSFISKS